MSKLSPILYRRSRPRIFVDPQSPEGAAVCDGCHGHVPADCLVEQKDYRGGSIPVGTGLMHCPKCLDVPNPQGKLQVLRPDPVPLPHARPDNQMIGLPWSQIGAPPWMWEVENVWSDWQGV